MASPVLETYCCMFPRSENWTDIHPPDGRESYDISTLMAYNIFSIISSSLSIGGAVYQWLPKKLASHIRTEREIKSALRQNYIISWLTVADFAATVGVLIRSSYWLNGQLNTAINNLTNTHNGSFDHNFCIITSAWIQYFYISTYFWTFIFALDTYYLTLNRRSYHRLYHMLIWGITALLCAISLAVLYAPDLKECQCWNRLIPYYICSILPLLFTLIANPILYSKTSKSVQMHICGGGSFTDRERKVVHSLKVRFRAFMIAFTVCWIPTLASVLAVPIVYNMEAKPVAFMAILCLTSILNPLQGFLNSLLYRGVGLCPSGYLRESEFEQPVTTNSSDSLTRLLDSSDST